MNDEESFFPNILNTKRAICIFSPYLCNSIVTPCPDENVAVRVSRQQVALEKKFTLMRQANEYLYPYIL